MGIGAEPGMVYGQVLEFFFPKGSLQRAWQETGLNFWELQIFTAEVVKASTQRSFVIWIKAGQFESHIDAPYSQNIIQITIQTYNEI